MNIVQHLFDSSTTDSVSFARKGESFTELKRAGTEVAYSVRLVEENFFRPYLDITAKQETGFSITAVRNYLRIDGEGSVSEQEALFGNVTSNCISRISTRGQEQQLDLVISAANLTCLRTSLDGRYIAVGNGDGQFEVWNMDMEPRRIYSFGFVEPGSIADLCFSRTNMELVVVTTCATTHVFDLSHSGDRDMSYGGGANVSPSDNVRTLNSESGWPCYTADAQTDGNGMLFGGEYDVLWLLGVKGAQLDKDVSVDDLPFRMTQFHNVAGTPYWCVAAMPQASIGCIRTKVGGYISQARFLKDDLICVLGDKATEVWSLAGEAPSLVARKAHDRDCRALGFGGNSGLVRVALTRPF